MKKENNSEMDKIQKEVESCQQCGKSFGNSAVGFGKKENPLIFFVGINPWVRNHEFNDGRGITLFKRKLAEFKFDEFYFDNLIKCQMPGDFKPDSFHAYNCIVFLRRQIEAVKPRNIILFGKMVQEIVSNDPVIYSLCNQLNIRMENFPHFSSIYYPGFYSEEVYYRRFKSLLDRMKKK